MFKANANVTFTRDGEGEDASVYVEVAVNKVFYTAGDGLWSEVAKDVLVTSIGMHIALYSEDGEYYSDGDLGVNYDERTWDNNTDGLIYTDRLFIKQVQEYLIAQGVDANIANDISYSEQGMQDDGRVSCDAYAFADYVRSITSQTA